VDCSADSVGALRTWRRRKIWVVVGEVVLGWKDPVYEMGLAAVVVMEVILMFLQLEMILLGLMDLVEHG
jgi:hypothetical protein